MPRTPKKTPNALVASAAKVIAGRRKNIPQGSAVAWQNEAWEMLDSVGELEFYREWMSNALSRCTLTVVEDLPDGTTVPATDQTVLDAMAALFGGEAGQAEMLAAMGGHLAIPGETWLCGLLEYPEDPDGPDLWRVLSRDEVRASGNRWEINRGDAEPETYAADQVYLIRIWRPHPRKHVEAHSSVRSALPILRQIVGLTQRVSADIDSRLKGAGILFVPSEVTFSSPVDADDSGDSAAPEDPFLATLIETMTVALEDQGSAAAMAPIIAKIPGQYLQYIKHLTFATELDSEASALRQELLGRLANALDVPAEILLGMADVNHWTGWLLDDNAIKMHVEPLLGIVTHGLTTRYMWPALQGGAERFDPALRRFRIIGDTSELRQRPNRSADAQALHQSLTITNDALVRETGFETSDLLDPTSPEFQSRMLTDLALRGTPDVAVAALSALGINLDVQPTAAPDATGIPAAAPVQVIQNRREPPQQSQTAALLAVSEVLCLRAVERGWNRAGRRGRVRKPVDEMHLDSAMADAWTQIPRAAALTGVDPGRLQRTLDRYTRTLLVTGREHDPRALASCLVSDVLENRALEV